MTDDTSREDAMPDKGSDTPKLQDGIDHLSAGRQVVAAFYAADPERTDILNVLGHITTAIEQARQAQQRAG